LQELNVADQPGILVVRSLGDRPESEPDFAELHARPAAALAQVAVHDASSFEWRVSVPLRSQAAAHYSIEAEFEIPALATSVRSPWEQLYSFSRLEGPDASTLGDGSVDRLRRQVVGLTQMLGRAREGFDRHCKAICEAAPAEAEPGLTMWLDAALTALGKGRAGLTVAIPADSPELRRERVLADEFISVRLLELLADSQQALDRTTNALIAAHRDGSLVLDDVQRRLTSQLQVEIAYRKAHDFALPEPVATDQLESYVERVSRLKKHFQDVYALDRDVYLIDDRVRSWLTSFAALLAGTLAFVAQLLVGRMPSNSGVRIGFGIAGLALLTGILYAAREQLKELARAWISGKVFRYYAQRIVRCRMPSGKPKAGALVVRAREWCSETPGAQPDPLNPESGAMQRFTRVHHIHRGQLLPAPSLTSVGGEHLWQVFRYDLTPLFSRLSDPVRRVATGDFTTGRPTFVLAPRRYKVPVRVRVSLEGRLTLAAGNVVVDKQGIQRLEPSLELAPLAADAVRPN
jgi:hypothetical protein